MALRIKMNQFTIKFASPEKYFTIQTVLFFDFAKKKKKSEFLHGTKWILISLIYIYGKKDPIMKEKNRILLCI